MSLCQKYSGNNFGFDFTTVLDWLSSLIGLVLRHSIEIRSIQARWTFLLSVISRVIGIQVKRCYKRDRYFANELELASY